MMKLINRAISGGCTLEITTDEKIFNVNKNNIFEVNNYKLVLTNSTIIEKNCIRKVNII